MSKKRIVVTVVTIMLFVSVLGVGIYYGRQNQDLKTEGYEPGEESVNIPSGVCKDIVAINRLGEVIKANSTINMQSFAYTCAEDSVNKEVTLSAKVEPNNATDKSLEWVVEWVNPGSAFSEGRSCLEYVNIEPIEEGEKCIVKYVKDFGSQIKITAVSKSDPDIKASIFVDCVRKYKFKSGEYDLTKLIVNLDYTTNYTVDLLEKNEFQNNAEIKLHKDITDELIKTGLYTEYLVKEGLKVDFIFNEEKVRLEANLPYKTLVERRFGKKNSTFDEIVQVLSTYKYKKNLRLGVLEGDILATYSVIKVQGVQVTVPYDDWRVKTTGIVIGNENILY